MALAAAKFQSDETLLDAYSTTVADAVDRIGPAVCRIERIGGQGGHGSGFVIAPDGLVVTNFHVVGDAKTVRVSMPDGASSEGRVLGRDPDTDIALVRADGSFADVAPLGDSKRPAARPDRHCHRQSARLRIDGDGRRRIGARSLAALLQRPADRRRHPDRCRAQSRQFRRAAGLLARRGYQASTPP